MAKYNYFAKGMDQLLFNDTKNIIATDTENSNANIDFENDINTNDDGQRCGLRCKHGFLLNLRKPFIYLSMLIDLIRAFYIILYCLYNVQILDFRQVLLILFSPSILLCIHFIVLYIMLYRKLPLIQYCHYAVFIDIMIIIILLPIFVILSHCTSIMVFEGSKCGLNRFFINKRNEFGQNMILKLIKYLFHQKKSEFDKTVISINYYLYLLLEIEQDENGQNLNDYKQDIIEQESESYMNYIDDIYRNCNYDTHFEMDSSLSRMRQVALNMHKSSKLDVIILIWFQWLKSSIFYRYYKLKQHTKILNKIELNSNWLIVTTFLINLFLNKLWIILLPLILNLFALTKMDESNFMGFWSIIFMLDLFLIFIGSKVYIPLCYQLFHILPMINMFGITLKYINWDKYIDIDIDCKNYGDIIGHIEEIKDILFIEKERYSIVYQYLYSNVASIVFEYAERKLCHLSFLCDDQCYIYDQQLAIVYD